MTSDEILNKFLSSEEKGLSSREAKNRLHKYGRNKLPEAKKKSALLRFGAQFCNVLIYLLIFSAVVTFLMDHRIDAFVILGVVIANAIIGFVQEGKAEKALEGIQKMLSLNALVIRDGNLQKINAEELVPGDIVMLRFGDKVPADLRIINENNLRVEEAPLTGESSEVTKSNQVLEEDVVIGDRKNMLFSGTLITFGEAKGIVVGTGLDTEIGKITVMISDIKKMTTPLLDKIDNFGKYLSVFTIIVALAFFSFGYFVRDYSYIDIFLATISLVVAIIPESLPAVVTIALAIGVQRMAKRNAIVRRLPSVETLGSVNVICSDKTGTLTKNEMTAKTIVTSEDKYEVEGAGYDPEGSITKKGNVFELNEEKVLKLLITTGRICNDSEIEKNDEGRWRVAGTATEGALVTLAHKAGLGELNAERLDSIPFNSSNKFMTTLNDFEEKRYIFFKGAPETLISYCDKQLTAEGEKDLDEEYWVNSMNSIAEKGERIIALAFRRADGLEKIDLNNIGKNFTFLGLVGIVDPPREEALEAIVDCKKAGIRVIMITGDHAVTANAIAHQLGIGNEYGVLTGVDLEKLNEEEFKEVVLKYNVFARTDPEHKLRLVKALQANNLLCAMTGDGVNDAPALKKANIGIAMGIKGTEVSKEAAEIILTDDNFASIVNAVKEGRTVYDNIKKTIIFVLPTNFAESLVLIIAVLFGITMPITPVQILWVNLITTVTLDLALALGPVENNVMFYGPREKDEPILGKYLIMRTVFVGIIIGSLTLFLYNMIFDSKLEIAYARTIAVNMLVAGQAFYLLNCRKIHDNVLDSNFFRNKEIFLALGILIIFQLVLTYVPFMNLSFGTVPLSFMDWFYPVIGGLLVFLIVEGEKYFTKKFFK